MTPELAFGMFLVVASTVILSAIALAVTLTMDLGGRRKHRMDVEHPIAVGRSGRPEITDPMPTPARVRRPVSEAYNPEKRTLFEER